MVSMRRTHENALPLCVLVLCAACGSPRLPAAPQGGAPDGFGGSDAVAASSAQCVVPKGETKPFVVEWDAGKRNEVRQLSNDGLLLVVHSGCGLTFLDGCEVGGGYEDVKAGGGKIADAFDIGSAAQLKSKLPIGFFELYGRFHKDDRWTLEYVFADSRKARTGSLRRSELPPQCAQATHYVSRIMLGAYRLRSAAALGGEAGAGVGGVGVSAEGGSDAEIIRQGGDFEACRAEETPSDAAACQAIVQIYLREVADDVDGTGDAPRSEEARAPLRSAGSAPGRGPGGQGAGAASTSPWTPTSSVAADWGWLTVRANATSVPVMVDRVEVGETPLNDHKMKAGHHVVELQQECFYPGRREVDVAAGETTEVRLDLAPREGAVEILVTDANGKPVRADVFLNGRALGRTGAKLSGELYKISACESGERLVVRAPGYRPFEQIVRIAERETTGVQVELEAAAPDEASGVRRPDDEGQPGTRLRWLRCPVGQTWSGSACVGSAAKLDWRAARTSCPSGFRLPTRQEIVDLLGACDDAVRSGQSGYCRACDAGDTCRAMFTPDSGVYWVASPLDDSRAWRTGFGDGRLSIWYLLDEEYSVRCVSSGEP